MPILLLAQAAATLIMTGLIWFVQIVHYPLFSQVGAEQFERYEAAHTARTTWVVGPPMLVEAVTALLLLWRRPAGIDLMQVWLGAGLLGVVWLSTAFVQVPRHNVLSRGFDAVAHGQLVASNWLRTVAWSLRSVLVLWMIARLMN
jgi:hypothetical protein